MTVPFKKPEPDPPEEDRQSTEDRLLDLLTRSMDRQVSAVERLESSIGDKLGKLDDSVDRLATSVSGVQAGGKVIVAVLTFAAVIVALAMGMDVALSWGDATATATHDGP